MVKILLIQLFVLHKEIVLIKDVFAIPITLDKIVMFLSVQMLEVTILHVMVQILEHVLLLSTAHVIFLLQESIALSASLGTQERYVWIQYASDYQVQISLCALEMGNALHQIIAVAMLITLEQLVQVVLFPALELIQKIHLFALHTEHVLKKTHVFVTMVILGTIANSSTVLEKIHQTQMYALLMVNALV
jgi:hypothetical protein